MPDAVIHSTRSFHPARRRRRPRLGAAILALVACLCARTASADAVALTGRVTDGHGGVVAGADVRVRRDDGTVSRRTASDATGTFTIAALPAGDYVVEIEKPGFRADVAIVNLAGDGTATHDVELGAAGVRESVVVTASGLPQSTLETSKAVSVIDAEEITARNAVTLADVVRLTPGVQVRDAGGPGQLGTLRIRGLRSDAAAVLVDGVRLRDAASTQGDITGFFSNLGVVDFDRVEVLRGSASSLYGTNAVGGAINIVTREGGPQRSEGQLEIGSLGHSRVRGTTGGTLGGGRVAYSAGGLHWLVRDGVDGDDRARSAGGQGSVRAQLDAATSLGVRIYGSNDRVHTNASPTASGVPAANIPDATIVDAIAHPDRGARARQRRPAVRVRRRHVHPRPQRSGQRPRLALPDDRDHAAPRRVRSRQLAGQLPARRHVPPLRVAGRSVPASRPRRCRCRSSTAAPTRSRRAGTCSRPRG